jgi:Family of unknown function (DUF6516)
MCKSTYGLVSKTRVELASGHTLELFFVESTAQYANALLREGQRVIGWDNARHDPHLQNAPHQFHREDGSVEGSAVTGDPPHDIRLVAERINEVLAL